MDPLVFSLESPLLLSALHHLADLPEETEKSVNAPTRTYVRDTRAMASTPADVKELPFAYVFVLDMPGVKSGEINVQVESDSLLVIAGERRREDEKEQKDKESSGKYLRMERRMGKFMRKFSLPDNANLEGISAVCRDGVLSVTVEKLPPPEPKKPKTIEVKIA
ncbi:HSP20 family small heat-shock protein [Salmonella sp. NW172]